MTDPTKAQDEGAALSDEDHAVIKRCVERQPKLYVRGQHEGYYIHSDIASLIDMIGRTHPSPPPAADEDRVRIAVEAITKAKDLDVNLLHDGYDSGAGGGNYVYADVVRTDELFPLLDQALAALKSEGK